MREPLIGFESGGEPLGEVPVEAEDRQPDGRQRGNHQRSDAHLKDHASLDLIDIARGQITLDHDLVDAVGNQDQERAPDQHGGRGDRLPTAFEVQQAVVALGARRPPDGAEAARHGTDRRGHDDDDRTREDEELDHVRPDDGSHAPECGIDRGEPADRRHAHPEGQLGRGGQGEAGGVKCRRHPAEAHADEEQAATRPQGQAETFFEVLVSRDQLQAVEEANKQVERQRQHPEESQRL